MIERSEGSTNSIPHRKLLRGVNEQSPCPVPGTWQVLGSHRFSSSSCRLLVIHGQDHSGVWKAQSGTKPCIFAQDSTMA